MTIEYKNLEEIGSAATQFLKQTSDKKHFAFYAEMGVGKTTFIKELCNQLGVKQVVTSPTFAIVNEYTINEKQKIYHFDLYRINKIEELYDIGFENYIFSENYCFIEWPEKAEELMPQHITKVYITENNDGSRKIEF